MQSLLTRRCYLREYAEEDREFFVALNGDEKARAFMNGPLAEAEANELFDETLAETRPHQGFRWAVFTRKSDEYIGHFFAIPWETERAMEWGIVVRPDLWGKGLGTEVCAAALEFAFRAQSFRLMVATADQRHLAAQQLLDKLGLRRSEAFRDEGGVYYLYTADREEFLANWPEVQKRLWPHYCPSKARGRKKVAKAQDVA